MIELTLYTRADCCLCDEMKQILAEVLPRFDSNLTRVEIDNHPELEAQFGHEVPVLFVNNRKAFKFRCTARELRRRLMHEVRR